MSDHESNNLSPAAAAEVAAPIIGPGYNYASATDKISAIVLTRRTPKWWLVGFAITFSLVMMLLVVVTYLFAGAHLSRRDLHPGAWRRPIALPASLLVLFSPSRLHHDFAGDGSDQ